MSEPTAPSQDIAPQLTGARIVKVVSFPGPGAAGGEAQVFASKQITEDPYGKGSLAYGKRLAAPIFSLEALQQLSEAETRHGSALDQKSVDIIAKGPQFILTDTSDGAAEDEEQKGQLERWWASLFEQTEGYSGVGHDATPVEAHLATEYDRQSLGWGIIEVVRDSTPEKAVRGLYHVPGMTVRAAIDGETFVQLRGRTQVWFKRWGASQEYYSKTGQLAPQEVLTEEAATELLVFRKLNGRSTWYGIPTWISAMRSIALSVAARDYNIAFFTNAREPRRVFVISGLAENVGPAIDDLARELELQHNDPHRNLILPMIGDGKVEVIELSRQLNDAHFTKMLDQCGEDILIGHRMPPDRLGLAARGPLSGNASKEINQIYKQVVVDPGQALNEDRLNRFLRVEAPKALKIDPKALKYKIDFEELDLSDERLNADLVLMLVKGNLLTINEGRKELKKPELPVIGDMLLAQFVASLGGNPMQNSAGTGFEFDPGLGDVWTGNRRIAEAAMAMMDRLGNQYDRLTEALVMTDDMDGHIDAQELLSGLAR